MENRLRGPAIVRLALVVCDREQKILSDNFQNRNKFSMQRKIKKRKFIKNYIIFIFLFLSCTLVLYIPTYTSFIFRILLIYPCVMNVDYSNQFGPFWNLKGYVEIEEACELQKIIYVYKKIKGKLRLWLRLYIVHEMSFIII